MRRALSVVLLLTTALACAFALPTRVLFNSTEVSQWGARCIDGSPSGFYYEAATNPANADKWFVYLEGGGYCLIDQAVGANVQSCASRLGTVQGTSNLWPEFINRTSFSLFFNDWNYVHVPYCGGDLHAGQMTTPVSGLYQAGHLTFVSVVRRLLSNYNITAASSVMFAGSSAGGLGVYANANYFKSQLPNTIDFRSWTSAGWFIDTGATYNPGFLNNAFSVIYSKVSAYVNQECAAARPTTPYECFSGNFSFPYFTFPIFIANSIFDNNLLVGQAGVWYYGPDFPDAASNVYTINVGKVMNETLLQVLNKPDAGLFTTSSFTHTWTSNNIVTKGQTVNETLYAWYYNGTNGKSTKVMSACGTPNCLNIVTSYTTTGDNAAVAVSSVAAVAFALFSVLCVLVL